MSSERSPLLSADGRFRLGNLTRARRGAWFLASSVGAVTLFATVALLALSGWFITAAAGAGAANLATAYNFNYLIPAAIIRLLAIIRTAGRYGERMASHNAVLALLADLRSVCFARLLAAPHSTANLSVKRMHRLTGDIDLLDNWPLAVILPWIWALVLQLAFFLFTWLLAPSLLPWLVPPLLCAGLILPLSTAHHAGRLAREAADAGERRRAGLLTPLPALTALLQWQRWDSFAAAFEKSADAYDTIQRRAERLDDRVVLLQQTAFVVLIAVLLWRGGLLLDSHRLVPAELLALLLGIFGLNEILLPLGAKLTAAGLGIAARDRLNALLPTQTAVHKDITSDIPKAPYLLQAEGLYARHHDALNGAEDVRFTLKSGETMIISGVSGGGKSTLLAVLAGELAAEKGSLTLNGKDYGAWQVQKMIACLGQQLDIFDLTLAENLCLGDPRASDTALWQVLEKVALADWAKAQPRKLATPLGEYGTAISGGQARRIALARLLLGKRPILLLDEPFAGLDDDTHQKILSMLREEMRDGILVIVSHLDAGVRGVEHLVLSDPAPSMT